MKIEQKTNPWKFILILLLVLLLFGFILAWIFSLFIGSGIQPNGNVAVIPIQGVITSYDSVQFLGESTISSPIIVDFIEQADRNPSIKAILLEIDSGGGSPVGSEEIVNAVKKTNNTTVALIREMGASGAYWVASASDYIICNKMSIVGSVGVIASYLQFSGLLDKYNITYERLVSGERKDLGSSLKELTPFERSLLQDKVDLLHDYFLDDVVKSRKLTDDQKSEVATSEFYLGMEAKDLGLVDAFGGEDEAVVYIQDIIKEEPVLAEYRQRRTLLDIFSSMMNERSFFMGKGIGSALLNPKQANNINIMT
jgi:protease-4